MAKRKRTNNDLQTSTYKTKEGVTRTPQKTGGELRCSSAYQLSIDHYSNVNRKPLVVQ